MDLTRSNKKILINSHNLRVTTSGYSGKVMLLGSIDCVLRGFHRGPGPPMLLYKRGLSRRSEVEWGSKLETALHQ